MATSRCGLRCTECEIYQKAECPGCMEAGKTPFQDECQVAICCKEKKLTHCGQCTQIPCEKWKMLSRDERMMEGREEQLQAWQAAERLDAPDSRCGLRCTGCGYRESHGCRGCMETDGHPFHGACPVALCCQGKGLVHCGQCPEMPCAQLYAYSCCDYEHGDHPMGGRIAICQRWKEREKG